MNVKTVSAILVWFTVLLLILNNYFRSGLIFFMSIAVLIIAVLIYFIPRFRKY